MSKSKKLDDEMTFLGIMMGLLLGVFVALTRVKHRGAHTRENLVRFGSATLDQEISESLSDAKQQAQSRISSDMN